jgi:saccharopine dehydrogenase (NADP+, L-glutamate forming)/spermidine synthase
MNDRKKVLILGAGQMAKPMVDYFLDKCGYDVIVASRTVEKAIQIINGRTNGKAVSWTVDQMADLETMTQEVDIVMILIPRYYQVEVMKLCIKHKKPCVTTDYLTPEMRAFDEDAKKAGIIIFAEIGDGLGLDHICNMKLIDEARAEGYQVSDIITLASGIPACDVAITNPFTYKFNWNPIGFFMTIQTDSVLIENGKEKKYPGSEVFDEHHLLEIPEFGCTYEVYPKGQVQHYIEPYGLELEGLNWYRGLLRYPGYSNTMKGLMDLGLGDWKTKMSFEGLTYGGFMKKILNREEAASAEDALAEHLGVNKIDDFVKRLKWLGILDDTEPIPIKEGTKLDILSRLMLERLSYQPGEKDLTLIYSEVVGVKPDGEKVKKKGWNATEGIPNGDSAMARCVSLPTSICGRLILEGKLPGAGIQIPVDSTAYNPVLKELDEDFEITFSFSSEVL